MSKRFVTALSVFGTLLIAGAASAQTRAGGGAIEYATAVSRGHEALRSGDQQHAGDAYTQAASLRAQSGEPHLFLAEASRVAGQLSASLEHFREADRLATQSGASEDGIRAKALFGIAMVLEAQRELGPAREAWQAYLRFAESHTALPVYVASARARVQALDRVEELDQAYAPVRERLQGARRGR